MQGNKDLTNGTAAIKVEPGTSRQRLPSLKAPRDLSLASLTSKVLPNANQAKKKVYMPRLNVQRNRPQEVLVTGSIKQEPKENKPRNNSSERGRGRGGKRGNIIQSGSSIFAEGLAPSLKSSRLSRYSSGGGDGPSEKATLEKPKLSKQENIKIDKDEEDMMLKELLRDDFIDDPSLEPDYQNCPVKLPLSESSIFSSNSTDEAKKIKTEPDAVNNDCQPTPIGSAIKIKIEPGLEDDIKEKLTEIKLDVDTRVKKEKNNVPSVREIMHSKEAQFVMLQLPSCLPGLKPEVEPSVRPNQPTPSQTNGPTTSNNASSSAEQSTSKSVPEPRCTLQTLKPGKIGKMQVLKSGRVRLILGETKLWLEMGTQVSFRQDLISADLNEKTKSGKTICMGSVPLRMTVTPDWEHLISSRTVL